LTVKDLQDTNLDVCEFPSDKLRAGIKAQDACPDVSRRILEVYFGGRPTSSSVLQTVNVSLKKYQTRMQPLNKANANL